MKQLLTISCILLSIFPVYSQEMSKRQFPPLEFYFSAGGEYSNPGNLNERLGTLGVDKADKFGMAGGFGLSYRIQHVILGLNTSISSSSFRTEDDNHVKNSYIGFYLSTNALRANNLIISPQVGIGYGETRARFVKEGVTGTFDEFLTTTSNRVQLENKGEALDFGIAFKKAKPNTDFYKTLFKIGYRHGLKEKEWKITDASVTGAPTDRIRNFYVQLLFGFGR